MRTAISAGNLKKLQVSRVHHSDGAVPSVSRGACIAGRVTASAAVDSTARSTHNEPDRQLDCRVAAAAAGAAAPDVGTAARCGKTVGERTYQLVNWLRLHSTRSTTYSDNGAGLRERAEQRDLQMATTDAVGAIL